MELERAWCRETAHPSYRDRWSEDNPSVGQCCVTALAIWDLWGGDIYRCKVKGKSHFVNVIGGRIIDETADQFGDIKEVQYNDLEVVCPITLLKNQNVRQRYELLKARLEES